MLEHGGDLVSAARRYNIAEDQWLDLSTGINPLGWPVAEIPPHIWQRLPNLEHSASQHACEYYGCFNALPVAGSQAAIQLLPGLRKPSRVGVVSPTYAEHAQAWLNQGHQLNLVAYDEVDEKLAELDVLVVVNPNNPTGHLFTVDTLLDWHQQLSARGGWLVVDEAFMDSTPQHSLAQHSHQQGLVVLRSVGKFFGLAGMRCGFVLAANDLLQQLKNGLGPWSVNGPALYVISQAMQDKNWQESTRQLLMARATRLVDLLEQAGMNRQGGTSLFQWVMPEDSLAIYEALASQGILARYFSADVTGKASLRFGLPASEQQWQRLEQALEKIVTPGLASSRG